MIDEISIIMPCEQNRVGLLMKTLSAYLDYGFPIKVEFVLVTRTIEKFEVPGIDIKLVKYKWEGESFNPSLALNLGVKNATYENVIITCPEVKPITNVIEQLSQNVRGNYLCQVFDEDSNGSVTRSLVNKYHRGETPGMYFLACFIKEDLYKINGWDEDFMKGYAWEDSDFGERWIRAGIPFQNKDGIKGVHQFHVRGLCDSHWDTNKQVYINNRELGVTYCKNGLVKRNE